MAMTGGQITAQEGARVIDLPPPRLESGVSLESALLQRRSVREFGAQRLTLGHVAQLLWAAQGVTGHGGLRTAPSAGALYPLELYLLAAGVEGAPAGLYRYEPARHALERVSTHDHRARVARTSARQTWIREAPAVLVIAAVYDRTKGKYGERGIRYVHMEVGHAAQNVYLQATAMGLGTTFVGAFSDGAVRDVLELPDEQAPLGIMPLGWRR
jgi:SagB-type dehydrogenase family enzyme